jgi:eukaryotic-like serine/threonine-protein kinase
MTAVMERLAAALADRYRIERELGAGGMATVYLAEDLKHGRKVALKVLKPELAAVLGAERFVVEIKTTAALQHPHILPLFDSGTADGFLFYVMPFIDGETLRDKLNRETQLSVDEAVRITREVADALHYAHTQGVIHRDIKPENVLLANGRPMVADFGIALAVSAAAGGRMTETGLSLGTPHYMSPEQATAEKEITGRSDVYSLASVCYEMLTGNPPHVGSSAQQIIMRIITEQPEAVTKHRKSVPPHVAAAVAKALEKLPADRFETAEKFAEALANASFTTMTTAGAAAAARGGSRGALLAVSAIAVIATAAATWLAVRPLPDAPAMRFRLALPDSQMPVPGSAAPVPAPDGSFLIYNGPVSGEPALSQLWIKRRDALEAAPIPGTRGAGTTAISPDGTRIAFENAGRLHVMPITGGVSQVLMEPTVLRFGMAWMDNLRILFTAPPPAKQNLIEIFVIPAGGGPAHSLGLTANNRAAVLPQPVHGRDAMLYLSCITEVDCDLHAFDFRDSSSKQLVPGSRVGTFAASGHLVYERSRTLVATGFDVDKLELRGDVVPLLDNIGLPLGTYAVNLSLDGTLAARVGGSADGGVPQEMVWVDRSGRQELVDSTMSPLRMTVTGTNHGWSLSPDGTRVALGLATASGDDIWVKQLPRGALTRATLESAAEFRPRWSPDGLSLVYSTIADVRTKRADGTGRDSVILNGQVNEAKYSSDGKWLLVRAGAATSIDGGRDILVMRIGVDTALRPLVAAPGYDETAPSLSPDGNWLLYQSDESGRREIYVRPFPDVDQGRVQVSVGGGEAPLWSRNGREIFFLSADRQMMAVSFTAAATPTLTAPRALFTVPPALLGVETAYTTPWDVAADGRFLMMRSIGQTEGSARIPVVVHNLFTELRARLGR